MHIHMLCENKKRRYSTRQSSTRRSLACSRITSTRTFAQADNEGHDWLPWYQLQ